MEADPIREGPHQQLVEHQAQQPDGGVEGELDALIGQSAALEDPGGADEVVDDEAGGEPDRRRDQVVEGGELGERDQQAEVDDVGTPSDHHVAQQLDAEPVGRGREQELDDGGEPLSPAREGRLANAVRDHLETVPPSGVANRGRPIWSNPGPPADDESAGVLYAPPVTPTATVGNEPQAPALAPSRVLLGLVFGAYALVLAAGVASHEPWFDEAQSWLLARDASLPELLTTYLRYEGHPPLWYVLLAPLAKAGLPYRSGEVLSACFAALGVLLLLGNRGIPLWLRALVPFGFFIAFQYAVVARSYALVFPLLMAIERLYPSRRERVVAFATLLALLSLVSVHGVAMAGAFALVYLLDLYRSGRSLDGGERRRHLLAGGVLALTLALLVWTLYPPADLLIADKLDFQFAPSDVLLFAAASVGGAVAGSALWSWLALALLLPWLWSRGVLLLFSLLVGGLAAVMTIYHNIWHEGLVYLALLFCVLLAFDRRWTIDRAPPRARAALAAVAAGVVAAVLLVHAVWTARTLGYDLRQPYSGSEAAADHIRREGIDERRLFGVGFASLAVAPYFDEEVFDNYGASNGFAFWDWSSRSPWYFPWKYRPEERASALDSWIDAQLAEQPDAFLVSQKFPYEQRYLLRLLASDRYRVTAVFPGGIFWKDHVYEPETFVLLEREEETE